MPLRSILSLHSYWHILFRHGKKQQQQQKTNDIYIYHQQEHIVHHMRIVRGIDCHVAISIAASQKLPFFRGGTCLDPATGRFPPSNTTTLLRCNLQANKVFSMANCDRLAKQFDVALTLGLKHFGNLCGSSSDMSVCLVMPQLEWRKFGHSTPDWVDVLSPRLHSHHL